MVHPPETVLLFWVAPFLRRVLTGAFLNPSYLMVMGHTSSFLVVATSEASYCEHFMANPHEIVGTFPGDESGHVVHHKEEDSAVKQLSIQSGF